MTRAQHTEQGPSRRAVVAGGAALATASLAACASASAEGVVKTAQGSIRGTQIEGVTGYLGIPYGAPPVGPLRFKAPVKAAAWEGERDGARYGFKCVQTLRSGFSPEGQAVTADVAERPPPLTKVPASPEEAPAIPHSEDCLYLDVWTKAEAGAGKPVMVWLHGGGFAFGAGSDSIYTGVNFVNAGDVVLVNVTHRLNVFGYLCLDEIGGPAFAGSGNAGMQDIVLALEWVRDNIEAFGGDPGNVTIFGESGGGAKTTCLMAMPAAKGLFHKAIVMSGSANRMLEKPEATRYANLVMQELGVSDVAGLQAVPARRLFDASEAANRKLGGGMPGMVMTLWPVVDGVVLPSHPFDPAAPAISAGVPLMVGTTKDEAALMYRMAPDPAVMEAMTEDQLRQQVRAFAGPLADEAIATDKQIRPDDSPLHRSISIRTAAATRANAYLMAERKVAQGQAPTYLYIFAWHAPGDAAKYRANHGLDVGLTFSNSHLSSWTGSAPESLAMQKVMTATWTAFAHKGDPSNPAIPPWPPYDLTERPTMLLDAPSRVVNDFEGTSRELWAKAPGVRPPM